MFAKWLMIVVFLVLFLFLLDKNIGKVKGPNSRTQHVVPPIQKPAYGHLRKCLL